MERLMKVVYSVTDSYTFCPKAATSFDCIEKARNYREKYVKGEGYLWRSVVQRYRAGHYNVTAIS